MTILFLKISNRSVADRYSGERPFSPAMNFVPIFLLLALVAIAWKLVFGYEDKALKVEDIESTLTPKELAAYRAA